MGVAGVGMNYAYQKYTVQNSQESKTAQFYGSISSAAELTDEENDSDILGLTMIPEEGTMVTYGMRAQYAAGSTDADPIVQVTSNYGGKSVSYNVHINEVDPKNASQLEVFALCSYADDKDISSNTTFGSYQKLKIYGMNAEYNGYCGSMGGTDNFLNAKFDWEDIVTQMMSDYLGAGIYDQYQDGKNLLNLFQDISDQFSDLTAKEADETATGMAYRNTISTVNKGTTDITTGNVEKELPGITAYYQGEKVNYEEDMLHDRKNYDAETGVTWYLNDERGPYLSEEDSEKLDKWCEENGVNKLKKFAEMTGLIRNYPDGTTVYVADNGIGVKGADGTELSIEYSSPSWYALMDAVDQMQGNPLEQQTWDKVMQNYEVKKAENQEITETQINKLLEYTKKETTVKDYAGMSFRDIINSHSMEGKQITTIHQIVSAKNPKDGKIYVTFFSDDKISCYGGDGSTAWEMNLKKETEQKTIADYFSNYKPDSEAVKEYYSDGRLGIVSSKDFWMDLLGRN